MPCIGVPAGSVHLDEIRAAGGEPIPLELPEARPTGGVALGREWVADTVQVFCDPLNLDALLIDAGHPEEMAALLAVALRLDLPAVHAPVKLSPFSVALAAFGVAPLVENPFETTVKVAERGEPRLSELMRSFSLANALRAGLSAGGGPEVLVHLAALAREAEITGCSRMFRVLAPESPSVAGTGWLAEHGAAGLLAHLGGELNDVPTVTGKLKKALPPPPPSPETEGMRTVFIEGRASGTEAVCRIPAGIREITGECRVFFSEDAAVKAVRGGEIGAGSFLVVGGCGPRGGPGLLKLDELGRALREADLAENVPVLTDGLAPAGDSGLWASLVTPEAAAGGIIGRLSDGDTLRMDLEEKRIRTDVSSEEFGLRKPHEGFKLSGAGYAARYARSALPALDGAGFS